MTTPLTSALPTTARGIGLLLARIGVGVVFLAHGLQKLQNGFSATEAGFTMMGVPAPSASAFYATWVETLGGAALIVGLLVPLVGVLLAADMIGAMVFVHFPHGIWVGDGGYELVLALGAGALGLAAAGAGAFSVDAVLSRLLPRRAARLLAPAAPTAQSA